MAGFGTWDLAQKYADADVWRPKYPRPGDQLHNASCSFDLEDDVDDFVAGDYSDVAGVVGRGAGFYGVDNRGTY